MLHWPDSMMTYLKEEQTPLFQRRLRGPPAPRASASTTASPTILRTITDQLKKYYANILMPFGRPHHPTL